MSDSAAASAPDNDYVSRPGQKQDPIPVEKDSETVESGVNPDTEDSDAQLGMVPFPFILESLSVAVH
jgi:hypothetical protein